MIANRRAQRALRFTPTLAMRHLRNAWQRAPQQPSARPRNLRLTFAIGAVVATVTIGIWHYTWSSRPSAVSLLPADIVGRVPTQDDSLFSIVVVAQRADCSGNLKQLSFLDRTAIARATPHRYLLVAGPSSDTLGLRQLLPHSLRQSRISLLKSGQLELLKQLGHDESPTMAVFDARNRLLVISATPPDAYARTVFVRALTRILSNNPVP